MIPSKASVFDAWPRCRTNVVFRASHAKLRESDRPAVSFARVVLEGMSRKTVEGCVERMGPLYEQDVDAIRIGQ